MNVELINVGRPPACEPLTCSRELGECRVANRRLADVQRERLTGAGLAVSEGLAEGLFVRSDAWLSDAALAACVERFRAWVIRDATGNDLAWAGARAGAPDTAERIPADPASFRIRYPWDVLRVNERLLACLTAGSIEGELSPAAHVEGILIVGPRSRVLPGVYIEGPVIIGADCKIGPNCYLRGCTSIGDRCHIGQAVEIKNSILLSDTSVGHLSYCGDSILGEHVNFGAGTITANFRHDGQNHRSAVDGVLIDTGRQKFGAIVGDNVHTGIHTAIYPGRKLWPGVTTRPGAVVQKDLRETRS